MPSRQHEMPLEFVRERPAHAVEILRMASECVIPGAGKKASLCGETHAELDPPELRCDATIVIGDPAAPDFAIIVESQLRYDRRKLFQLPAYTANLHNRKKCEVGMLVFCPDEKTAAKYDTEIRVGPGHTMRPVAVSPERLKPIKSLEEARAKPELTIYIAPPHAKGDEMMEVLAAYCAALDQIDPNKAMYYHDHAVSRMSDAARAVLEGMMTVMDYEWKSEFAKRHIAEGKAKGRAEGEAKVILKILARRDIEVSDEVRERITSTTDLEQIDRWVDKAFTVASADELFT